MFSSSLLSSSATILVLVCACNVLLPSVHSKCLCSVTKNGEYCGTELNALNSENECLKNIYFCGDSNRNREAAQLVQCPQGKECDIKTFSEFCLLACLFRVVLTSSPSLSSRSEQRMSQGRRVQVPQESEVGFNLLWRHVEWQELFAQRNLLLSLSVCHLPSHPSGCLYVWLPEWNVSPCSSCWCLEPGVIGPSSSRI